MILDRLKEFIDYKGLSVAAFERSIGMANASFGKSLKKGGAIGTDKLENILRTYPELSPQWLLKGEGEMILQKGNGSKTTNIIKGIPFIPENLIKVRYLDIHPTATFTEYESTPPEDYDYTFILPLPGEEFNENDIVFPVRGDSMEPRIPDNAEVLGKFIRKSQWHWAKGVVLIAFDNAFVIKRILENKLDSDNYLILGSDNPAYPKTIKVSLDSIHTMFKAERIVSATIL